MGGKQWRVLIMCDSGLSYTIYHNCSTKKALWGTRLALMAFNKAFAAVAVLLVSTTVGENLLRF